MPRGPRVTHQAPESQPPLTPRTRGSLLGVRVAIVGSGFAGSLLARILAVQGHGVALLERGTHPRFAIGESSTPLANLTLGGWRAATVWAIATISRRTAGGSRASPSCGGG